MDKTKSLKGTKTEKNICISYMDETQAYARYTYYAQQADKEKYFPIGEVFRDTATNELRHAKVFLKMLQGDSVAVQLEVDAGYLGQTAENLAVAIKEEMVNGYEFYTECAKTAKEEGFDEIAEHFTAIASIEKHHHDRFQHCLELINAGTLWKRDTPIEWTCLVCGYRYEGLTPPAKCPACDHPYQHYMPSDLM